MKHTLVKKEDGHELYKGTTRLVKWATAETYEYCQDQASRYDPDYVESAKAPAKAKAKPKNDPAA